MAPDRAPHCREIFRDRSINLQLAVGWFLTRGPRRGPSEFEYLAGDLIIDALVAAAKMGGPAMQAFLCKKKMPKKFVYVYFEKRIGFEW